jgi:carbon-monoxide dehydrogenase large subunit
MLVEGQIIGGTVQGIGGGLFERIAYDSEGQLLTGSLMDYMVPTASDVPDMRSRTSIRLRRSIRSA